MQVRFSMRMKLAALAGMALAAGGCATIHDHRGYVIDQALLDSVQPGVDNRLSVEHTLGRPTFTSQFGTPVWYYVSVDTAQPVARRPHPVKETVLRLTFDDKGNVARVDRAGLDKVVTLKPEKSETPTLGRQRTFLEDLFGNIGTVGAAGLGSGGSGPGGGGGGGGGGGPNGS
ncbi:MAG TPA: outer membrane protein assembly factor BamE [Novosphingobium sp.]|nr:outer membrane protein assembly factor BamE [Novosphingobium sp.]HZV08347.1 outer membrane protein assembly factor BamE [Novosphingobium sp.]